MEKRDYNEPTLENIFKLVKEMHGKVCPWIECACGKRMKDVGYDKCYDCSQADKPQQAPPKVDVPVDDVLEF